MTSRDKRSVGEVLLESDHIARAILMDVDGMDAAMMLRTWGEVVQATVELWQALPPATPPQPLTGEHLPDSADLAIQQLQAMTEAMHRTGHGRAWPGDGPADERLLRIAENFTRAADLISRHANPSPALSEPEERDLQAARTRIMHTLDVGSHGVAIGVGRRARELEMKMTTRGGLTTGCSLRQTRAAHARLTAFEQHAGAVITGTYPRELAGEHREPPAASRLSQALATWDIHAHRTLTDRVNTADLILTARTQSLVLAACNTLARVAADVGQLDRPAEPILGDWTSRSGFAAGRVVCDMSGVTAVFTANDQMAIGVLRALHECGRFVPDDVSVIGFDDIPEAEFLIPPLTTVREDFAAVGRRAIEALGQLMNGHRPSAGLLEPRVVVRASTAPPASIGAH